jgi:hypothetical protein
MFASCLFFLAIKLPFNVSSLSEQYKKSISKIGKRIILLPIIFISVFLLHTQYVLAQDSDNAPTITSITPLIGVEGDIITISGTNFDSDITNTIITFNSANATINSITSDSIVIAIPELATTGPISITTPNGTVTSSDAFVILPSPFTAEDIEYIDWVQTDQSYTATITEPGKVSLLLFNGTKGQKISLDGFGTTNFYLRVYNPEGIWVGGANGFPDLFFSSYTLEYTGIYMFSINPASSYLGGYTITFIDPIEDESRNIEPDGEPLLISTAFPGQNASVTFEGVAGDRISIHNTSSNRSRPTNLLITPSGSEVPEDNYSHSGIILQETGTYTYLARPEKKEVNDYTFTLFDVPDDFSSNILPDGQTVTIDITIAGQNAVLDFEGAEGQRISFYDTEYMFFDLSLYDPDGDLVGVYYNHIDPVTLPKTGSYKILVEPNTWFTGQVFVQLFDVPDDVNQTVEINAVPTVIDISTPGQMASVNFDGVEGQLIEIDIESNYYTFINITNPDGTFLEDDFYRNNMAFQLPMSGTYTILIDPEWLYTIPVTVLLYELTQNLVGTINIDGPSVTLTSSTPGVISKLTFQGDVGERISMTGDGLNRYYITLLDPNGSVLSSKTSSNSSFIDLTILPLTGTYSILIDPISTNTGDYTVNLFSVLIDEIATIDIDGESKTITTTSLGQNGTLNFSGISNQIVSLTSSGTNAYEISIIAPDGSTLGTHSNNLYRITLRQTGNYTIQINPYGTNIGDYTATLISLEDVVGEIYADGGINLFSTTKIGQKIKLTFNGTENQRINLHSSSAPKYHSIAVLNPDGSTLYGNDGYWRTYDFPDSLTLPSDGQYTIYINPYTTQVIDFDIQLWDVPDDLQALIEIDGLPITVTTTVPGQNIFLNFGAIAGKHFSYSIDSAESTIIRFYSPEGASLNTEYGVYTASDTGNYSVEIDPIALKVGTYTLSLFSVPDDISSNIAIGGPSVTVTTAEIGQNVYLFFEGVAGQKISLVSNSQKWHDITIRDPNDSYIFSKGGLSTFTYAFTLNETGTYSILVDPFIDNVGSFTLALYDAQDSPTKAIEINGDSVDATVDVPGQTAYLTFQGAEGQKISLTSTSSISHSVYIIDSNGNTLKRSRKPSLFYSTESIDAFDLPATDTYTVTIKSNSAATGTFSVNIYDVPDDVTLPIVIGGEQVIVPISVPGQNSILTFSGEIGDRISLSNSGPYKRTIIVDPEGNVLVSTSNHTIGLITLQVTGEYTIFIDPQYENIGSYSVTLIDEAPENVSNLQIAPQVDSITLSWDITSSIEASMYQLQFSDFSSIYLSAAETEYTFSNLTSNTVYPFSIATLDAEGYISEPISLTVSTLFDNPNISTIQPLSGRATIIWPSVTKPADITGYRVYKSLSPFSDVTGLTHVLEVNNLTTAATIAQLTNEIANYFAITVVNINGIENSLVNSTGVTPTIDVVGPQITSTLFNNAQLADDQIINSSGNLSVVAVDESGVAKVEFYIDDNLLASQFATNDTFTYFLDINAFTDGVSILTFKAYDSLGNVSELTKPIVFQMAPPTPPTITLPQNNTVTNQALIDVSGTGNGSEFQVFNNSQAVSQWLALANEIIFANVVLSAGSNVISVKSRNRSGESGFSNHVSVTLDTNIPSAPTGLSASARAQGAVVLSWNPGSGAGIAGYDVYRSTTEFVDISTAQRINTVHLSTTSFTDLLYDDGQYFYRVVAINVAETVSIPSNQASAVADSVAPDGVVTFEAQGAFDAASNVFGRGIIRVLLEVSEPLLATPFLSVKPAGSALILLNLQKESPTQYRADLNIDNETLTGVAVVIFSARDIANNQGTELQQGTSLSIDARGPRVTELVVTPAGPIKNDQQNPVTVNVQITLDEKIKIDEQANLSYSLNGSAAAPAVIDNLALASDYVWSGSFVLPADAGLSEAQLLSFDYLGTDELGNTSTTIIAPPQIQVYQGDLPPLAVPFGLSAIAKADGAVELSWLQVPQAQDYQLYRQAPGETKLSLYTRTAAELIFIDQTTSDGVYQYAAASVRQDNGEEALSVMSDVVSVVADRAVPLPPQNLSLELTPVGVVVTWESSTSTDVDSYQIYRDQSSPITAVDGLQPSISNIPSDSLSVLDSAPAQSLPAYVIVALDAAGNMSAPSNTGYLNVDLLPISTIRVEQHLSDNPVVSWTHDSNTLSGFDIYIGDKDSGFKLNNEVYTELSYTDSGYANTTRQYTVVALDDNGVESLARSINLPQVDIKLVEGEQLKTNLMNEVQFTVTNQGQSAISNAQLMVEIAGKLHFSNSFNLNAASDQQVTVIIGGYNTLSALSAFEVSLISKPNVGEEIVVTRDGAIEVLPGALILNIETQEMFFGGLGLVRFTIENTGETLLEIITALNNGKNDSNDIRLLLKDLDGNVLRSQTFRQVLGDAVVNLVTGQTVARVEAKQSFVSQWLDFDIPLVAHENAQLVLEIDNIYRHVGQADMVTLAGTNTTRELALTSTPYRGGSIVISPQYSFGEQDIVISGQAIDRMTAAPVANVDLSVVTNVNGFEKDVTVTTDDSGSFSYHYIAQSDESGHYKVSVIHPQLNERPDHGEFVISKVRLSPDEFDLAIPRNYSQTLTTVASTGEEIAFSNVRLVMRAEDQPGQLLPNDIILQLPGAIDFGPNQRTQLSIDMTAGDKADEQGIIVLALLADESSTQVLVTLTINYQLIIAQPSLYYAPSIIETGVALDGLVTETVTLENRGVDTMRDINLQLLRADDFPAPSWVSLSVASDFGDLLVGQQRAVSLNIQPQNLAATGVYEMKLKVSSSNHPVREVPVFVSITNSGVGGYQFKVSDPYTATLDEKGNLIQGLAAATVKLQNEDLPTLEYSLQTDSLGEAFFNQIPAGRYSYWVSANKHQERHGRIEVLPSVVRNEQVFLDYNFITLEWSVREIILEDRYEIVLNATYEVDVPAAVVVLEPSSVTLPDMAPGDVFFGELSITNHGLIRADDISYTFPTSNAYFQFDFLTVALPETLAAKGVSTIPYRVTALQSLQPELDGSGGGCYTFRQCLSSQAGYQCQNGDRSSTRSKSCWVYSYGSCSANGSGSGSGWIDDYSGGTFNQPELRPLPCRADGKDCKADGNGAGDQ